MSDKSDTEEIRETPKPKRKISEEQRQVLTKRLELARRVKKEKALQSQLKRETEKFDGIN